MLEGDYDFKIDIWSAGCVFGDLLNFTKGVNPGPLFNGRSCYPYSPKGNPTNEGDIDDQDQILKIMEVVGNSPLVS